MQSKKKWYKWSYLQNRKILLDLENEFLVAGGEGRMGERIVWKFGTDMSTLLYLKWITSKVLLYTAQGTLLSVRWQPGWEWRLEENGCMYLYGWVPSLFTWNYHNIVNQLYANTKEKFFKNLDINSYWVNLIWGVRYVEILSEIKSWVNRNQIVSK